MWYGEGGFACVCASVLRRCAHDLCVICVCFVLRWEGRQLIAGLVSVGLSILATLLAVDEIEVQVRRREAEPMKRLQRAGARSVAKLPGAARGSPGLPVGERSAARATGEIAAPTGGPSVRQKMGELPARPVANPEQPATLMLSLIHI